MATTVTVRDGRVDLPNELRDRFGIEDGTVLVAEADEHGIVLRPADTEPFGDFEIEIYTPERKAEFLLNNAMDATEHAWAREEARRLGFDPDSIPHGPPAR
jgi:bifunctional DNA-binding transcriptional regulator/antitoxin component of YhaV-PrlF toxin-antitoxin module